MIEDRLDKTVFSFTTREEAEAEDIDYWLSKTPTERIEALEHLRRWVYGDEAVDEPMRKDIFSFGQLGDE